eukprot:TRINITY_DN48978_c0_g1_i4.p1 TRINITY_DN48978_c0_g1~~TRINITY_DN48978_c0_g1_i4.p1  ORF type:complete len:268 (-),score=89.34 TRINITY_DN48978_c0_g1_i4:134-937(-)
MEGEIEGLLAPSLVEVRDTRKQILVERSEAQQVVAALREQAEEAHVSRTRMEVELEAAKDKLTEERCAFQERMAKLQGSVSSMTDMMDRTLARNRVLEDDLEQQGREVKRLQREQQEMEQVLVSQDAHIAAAKESADKGQEAQAQEGDGLRRTIAKLQDELKDARAGELALERQLHAVKLSIAKVQLGAPDAGSDDPDCSQSDAGSDVPGGSQPRSSAGDAQPAAVLWKAAASYDGDKRSSCSSAGGYANAPPGFVHQYPHVTRHLF